MLQGLAFVIATLAVFGWIANYSPGKAPVRAQAGVLDLRGADLERRIVTLDGEWEFYPHRLLAPDAFAGTPPAATEFLALPIYWKHTSRNDNPLENPGYATFRLKLLLPAGGKPLSLRLDYILSAYRLWANGRLIAQSGVPADEAAREVPEQRIRFATLPDDAPVVDLVLQASNFHPDWSSIRPLRLGGIDALTGWQSKRWAALYFVAGALLLMGIYHLALHLLHRENRATLYFGLYALLWMTAFLCLETNWAIRLFLPDLPAGTLFRLYQAAMIVASPLGYQFARELYPREFPRWILLFLWGASAIYLPLALLAPIGSFLALLDGYYLLQVARVFSLLWGFALAAWRSRDGGTTLLFGYGFFGMLGINDILNDRNIIDTAYLMHFGMLFFMVTQALVLAGRFSSLFDSVHHLSEALRRKNRLLKKEVEARIRAQQDTVAVGEAERSRISHALHDGLCQQLTGARLTCSILGRKWPAGQRTPAELDRLASILDESVSHAYDLSHGLWPVDSGDPDLCRALADFVTERQRSSKLPIALVVEGSCRTCVCNNAAHLHSIAREAVVNALKHAAPKKITIRLACRERERATLTVDDDGIGWAARPRTDDRSGIGLRIMAYRARMVGGEFNVGSGPDGGTRITASIPCRAA